MVLSSFLMLFSVDSLTVSTVGGVTGAATAGLRWRRKKNRAAAADRVTDAVLRTGVSDARRGLAGLGLLEPQAEALMEWFLSGGVEDGLNEIDFWNDGRVGRRER